MARFWQPQDRAGGFALQLPMTAWPDCGAGGSGPYPEPVYRFALRPRWILSHLFVAALVFIMVNAGLWQWGKYQNRLDENKVVRSRLSQPVVDLDALLSPGDSDDKAADLQNRLVRVTGRFLAGEQMLVRGRSLDGSPGSWVLTPLERADGTLAIINRGWIPNNGALIAVPSSMVPPTGQVEVEGLVHPTVVRERIGPTDPPTGRLTNLARPDIERYARQLDAPVVPAWIQLRSSTPSLRTGPDVPRVLGPPELDEGPYFSYTVQWFIFTAIALIGYPLILRRNAREHLVARRSGLEVSSYSVLEDDTAAKVSTPR